ncbi:MAG: oligopeptide/dipeptide ABC transporter ATP-binding protein, partial [Thermoplasmata archaeon]
AMALACEPALLIADEPTTALDVTVQLQILELLRSLQTQTGMSLLLITHDLGVVSEIADEVYVMYAGRIVEHAATSEILHQPRHPYTQALLRCTPRLADRSRRLEVIPGTMPGRGEHPPGCRFHPRCSLTQERAAAGERPTLEAATRPRVGPPPPIDGAPVPSGGRKNVPLDERRSHAGNPGERVLRRCVETYADEPSGAPSLREIRPGHFVACWEAG